MTTQLLLRIPNDLALRFKRSIPARRRSLFVQELLEKNLPDSDDIFYRAALAAEAFDSKNSEELAAFDVAMMDGLDPDETFDISKLEALCRK